MLLHDHARGTMHVRLDRPPPRLTDWMSRGSKAPPSLRRAPPGCECDIVCDVLDIPLGAPAGTWQVGKSGRYVAPSLPCPYLEGESLSRDGKPLRRRKPAPTNAGASPATGGSSASSAREGLLRRSRSVPPHAITGARQRGAQMQSPLQAACKAYASARAAGGASVRARQVLDSILAADAARLENSLAEYGHWTSRSELAGYREVWARITAAADAVGLDPETYAQLWEMQHRDIQVLPPHPPNPPPPPLTHTHTSEPPLLPTRGYPSFTLFKPSPPTHTHTYTHTHTPTHSHTHTAGRLRNAAEAQRDSQAADTRLFAGARKQEYLKLHMKNA
ncbi:hypothetical protein T492DRAFT_18681 [Pavlovales sp. CCMP2436]|nr:hypothetical protein T492DRAFT_18681 [Pavlovales sp. CCMP2436]